MFTRNKITRMADETVTIVCNYTPENSEVANRKEFVVEKKHLVFSESLKQMLEIPEDMRSEDCFTITTIEPEIMQICIDFMNYKVEVPDWNAKGVPCPLEFLKSRVGEDKTKLEKVKLAAHFLGL